MDQALVFAQGHILHPMQAILNDPMPALECQEPFRWSRLGTQAGDSIVEGLLGLTVLARGATQTKDLRQPWPGDVVVQIARGHQVAQLALTAMPPAVRLRLPLVEQA